MYTQTRDDDVSQNTQTDEIETTTKWCQCSHDVKSCGSKNGINCICLNCPIPSTQT